MKQSIDGLWFSQNRGRSGIDTGNSFFSLRINENIDWRDKCGKYTEMNISKSGSVWSEVKDETPFQILTGCLDKNNERPIAN